MNMTSRKSNHEETYITESIEDMVSLDMDTSVHEITDEIWFEVIRFCYGNKIGSVSLDIMFLQLPFVSRYFNTLSCRYVQRIPQHIYIFSRNADLAMLSWAWKKQVKVGSIIIADAINTLTMRIIIFLLSSVNILELHTLDLIRVTHISKCWNNVKKLKNAFPDNILRPRTQKFDHHYLHSSLASILSVEKTPVRKLKIAIEREVWPHCILHVVSETLEELHLTVMSKRENPSSDDFLNYLSETFEAMKKLKKLVLNIESPAELKIRSNTLEEIDTTFCNSNTTVVECCCPSLKMITTLYHRGRSSIRPCVPLKDGELDGRIESIQFEGENVASFTAKDRSFMGLAVPPSCKIRFILDKE